MARVPRADFSLENALWEDGFRLVAGVDEAGRGCLAGPVVAAAVILDPLSAPEGLEDSKILRFDVREALAPLIREYSVAWAIGICEPAEIDLLNILHASMEAMRRAVEALEVDPDYLLVDGNRAWPSPRHPVRTVVKGDAISRSIAAASILAKTARDRLMTERSAEYPGYGWDRNRGYPTRDHFAALARLGATSEHRRSFRLRLDPAQPDLFQG